MWSCFSILFLTFPVCRAMMSKLSSLHCKLILTGPLFCQFFHASRFCFFSYAIIIDKLQGLPSKLLILIILSFLLKKLSQNIISFSFQDSSPSLFLLPYSPAHTLWYCCHKCIGLLWRLVLVPVILEFISLHGEILGQFALTNSLQFIIKRARVIEWFLSWQACHLTEFLSGDIANDHMDHDRATSVHLFLWVTHEFKLTCHLS